MWDDPIVGIGTYSKNMFLQKLRSKFCGKTRSAQVVSLIYANWGIPCALVNEEAIYLSIRRHRMIAYQNSL